MSINWTVIGASLGSLFAGGGVSWLKLRFDQRKLSAETRSLNADAASTEAATESTLFDAIEDLRRRFISVEKHAADCDRENAELRRDNTALSDRITRLEEAMPMALVAARLEDYASLADLLDCITNPLVVSTPNNDGTLVWVNKAFCEALGRTREEILRIGWRGLIDPRDIRETSVMEAMAWSDRIWGFVNRYKHSDGSLVTFKWKCPAYKAGVTLSYVEVVPMRRKDDVT